MYLLSGSFAYDTILLHKGKFHTRILPEALSRLNVSFGMDSVKEEFGGTAGNIAYNATLLKQYPLLCASVGALDFERYEQHLKDNNLKTHTLRKVENQLTGHAWILTDTENNQISGFFSGAMKHKPYLPENTPDIWHLSPDSCTTTAWLAKTAKEKGKKYFFDPGQSLPSFLEGQADSIYSLKEIVENCSGMFVNEYEYQLMEEALKVDLKTLLSDKTEFIIQTLGSKGLNLYMNGKGIGIDVAKADKIVDPTGCGDAFRAGFLYGVVHQRSIPESAQLGATMGSFAIEESGGQNHKPDFNTIMTRYQNNFNSKVKNKIP